MNVMSLFDGMSCGQLALQKAGVCYDKYFACEIDKHAITITQKNFPETQQLGDIVNIKGAQYPKIDLLLGGSPCQSFSFAGKKEGFSGKSQLFWEFVRILQETQPTFFILENVKMKKEWEQVITQALGVTPIEINSCLVSPQNRARLYWTNIPNVEQPFDQKIKLVDVLENLPFDQQPYKENYISNKPILYTANKFQTLRASAGSRTRGIGLCNEKGWWRKLTPIECERLQTVPDNYTAGVSTTQRYKMLGNGWTVAVIAHILSAMPLKGGTDE